MTALELIEATMTPIAVFVLAAAHFYAKHDFKPVKQEISKMDPSTILSIIQTAVQITPELMASVEGAIATLKGAIHGTPLTQQQWDTIHAVGYAALAHVSGVQAAHSTFSDAGVMSAAQLDSANAEATAAALAANANLPTYSRKEAPGTPEQQATVALTPVTLPPIEPAMTEAHTSVEDDDYQAFLAWKKSHQTAS